MILSLAALAIGYGIDLLLGDPRSIPHPVVIIGKLISALEKVLRKVFPKTVTGENMAGLLLWIIVCAISFGVPFGIIFIAGKLGWWLRLILESIMCWQILATKSLRTESMKVADALKYEGLDSGRHAVSMIVGRDTESLDETGVIKATVETIAENSSDGIIAPMFFALIGGAPLGMLYKAVNTMDSMLGYVEEPYKNIGLFPAKMDDVFNFIPARISAFLMLAAGWFMKLDVKNGWYIFKRDRYNHASPNSAQTESCCAGLLQVRLAGDAWYHGVLHKKKYIGDDLRPIVLDDIPLTCDLMYVMSALGLIIFGLIKVAVIVAV
ncbi:MAG: cobalamin biosynthesis protein CobD [Firmicutes bacterium]|nr:cobalamin biosynthesis protein CobD [Bacillota bacterium]